MIQDEVGRRADVVDTALAELDFGDDDARELHEASRYLLEAGGKRLRPAIVLLVSEALDGGREQAMPAALAVEITHSFTLIHDDIMDDDPVRRGRPSVHVRWDVETAILTGDFLYSKAFEQVLDHVHPAERQNRMLRVLAETCTRICEGQYLDVGGEIQTEDDYLRMVELKTGVLFGAAAALGGLSAGAPEEDVDRLYDFGVKTGEAFQIHDDILDLTTPSEDLGKRRGSDLLEGKQTLVALHAQQQGVDPYLEADATEEDVASKVEELREVGSLDYAERRANSLVEEGKRALSVLPESREREHLMELADYLVSREY
ncbi:MAG: polyprenyl synthetase family protein [Halobacteriota archaeon]